jgi:hypothetical protein
MNGYTLSRQWFDFAAENPRLINVNHTALYFWLIELNNRRGFAVEFNFNTQDACDYIGVKNRKTVWEALNGLVEFGFVTIVYRANAPGKASVLSIINNVVESNGCLDKSLINQSVKRTSTETVNGQDNIQYGNGTETVNGHSYKQVNNKTLNNQTGDGLGFDNISDPPKQPKNLVNEFPPVAPPAVKAIGEPYSNYPFFTPNFLPVWKEFIELRNKKKKPLTGRAILMALNKLQDLSGGSAAKAIALVDQTLEKGWDTFYQIHAPAPHIAPLNTHNEVQYFSRASRAQQKREQREQQQREQQLAN